MNPETETTGRSPRRGGKPGPSAFTIVEILVATAVLAMILVLTLQILGNTNAVIRASDRQMDTAAQARAALDRFDADFSGAMLTHGASAICTLASGTTSPSIGFLCRSRAREADSGTPAWQDNLRGAIVGYRMQGSSLNRGDGRYTFNQQDVGNHVASELATIFPQLATALNSGGSFLVWTPLGDGVVRFHVSYQLDNGVITQTPPTYTMTSPQTSGSSTYVSTTFLNGANISPCLAIAFAKQNAPSSGSLQGRYVRALIVGVAAIDRRTLVQATNDLTQLGNLGTPGISPSVDTDTALALWEGNLGSITSAPLRQNLRFYQRVISVP